MMHSFAYMNSFTISESLYYLLWNEIEKLRRYFSKFCGQNTDEAMQRTLMHALTHYNESKGDVSAYVKSLAREITKDNGRLIFVDFLEQTLAESTDEDSKPRVDVGSVQDFSSSVINNIMVSNHKRKEVINLALCYIDKFMLMCEALISKDTSTNYYPEVFVKECIKLSRGCDNFNQICISVYKEYRDKFIEFLGYNLKDDGKMWRESDFPLIKQSESKRIKLVNPSTKEVVSDPDLENFKVVGNLGDKRLLKVRYYDIWESMCDYVDDTGINVMKFTIEDSFIVRTLGGSITVVNPDLYNVYDLCRTEILSNILHDLNARYIGIGSENFYIITGKSGKTDIPSRVVKGIPIEFDVIDITDSV